MHIRPQSRPTSVGRMVSSSAASASATSATTVAITATVASVVSFLELVFLIVLKVVVLVFWNHDQVDPSGADVLLVLVLMSCLTVLWSLKEAGCLTCKFSIGHGADFDRVLNQAQAMEEFEDVLLRD